MRWSVLAACLLGLVFGAADCFHPDVKNGGFACSMTDNPPCPAGFFCINGLCEDHPGASTPADLSSSGGNGGGGGGGAGGGGGGTVVDMSRPPADLAMSPGDMASAACAMSGDDCSSTPCCSGSTCLPSPFSICFP